MILSALEVLLFLGHFSRGVEACGRKHPQMSGKARGRMQDSEEVSHAKAGNNGLGRDGPPRVVGMHVEERGEDDGCRGR